jgi:GNAT superfamily N-acetyltransferase
VPARIEEIDPLERGGEVLELWNSQIGADFPLDERLYDQNLRLEKSLVLAFGAFEGGRLRGFALCKQANKALGDAGPRPGTGNISAILVDRAARRRGIGSLLLERVEGELASRGVFTLHLGRDTYHFFPGAPESAGEDSRALALFLDARGFAGGAMVHDLWADLAEVDPGARPASAAGFASGPYEEGDRRGLEDFLARCFPGRWQADTLEALEAGMAPRDLVLLRAKAGGEVLGFSRIYDGESPLLGPGLYWRRLLGPSPGGLGPMGVDERYRGRGLGLALLGDCLAELSRRGVRRMAIDWTDLVGFYGKRGFGIWKSYRLRSKALPGEAR